MFKKSLVGALAAVLMVEGALATASTAQAASYPKPKYSYNFNKADKNVIAVNRKDTDKAAGTAVPTDDFTGSPIKKASKKVTLKKSGRKSKSLYLDRTYGVQLKNMKLNAKRYSLAFWVKVDGGMADYMPTVFISGKDCLKSGNAKWLSVTKASWLSAPHSPVVWTKNEKKGQNPWTSDIAETPRELMVKDKWVHVAVTVGKEYGDAGAQSEYLTKGEDGYMKGNNVVIYVNGEMYGTGTPAADDICDGKESAYLGINHWDVRFKGYFDDVMFWNKALSEEQVQAVYKKTKGK